MTFTQTPYALRTRITEQEFMRLPTDGRKFELIDGEVREVATSVKHAQIVICMARLMGPFADEVGVLVGSQAGFRMRDGNIRCPDLSLTMYARLPNGEVPEGFGDFAPDLCIEVISPSEEPGDIRQKLQEYFEAGAQQVWHLFPQTQTLQVFTSPLDFTEYAPESEIRSDALLPGFRARVADLFAVQRIRPTL